MAATPSSLAPFETHGGRYAVYATNRTRVRSTAVVSRVDRRMATFTAPSLIWGNKSRSGKPYLESFGVRRPIQRPSRSSLIPQGEALPIDSGFAGVLFRYFGRYSWF